MFGHSAGAHILHRFALIYPLSKADRMLASNAGSYTLPNTNKSIPFGLKNTGTDDESLKKSFKKELVLFLGELDNEDDKSGKLLRSRSTDRQGTHRLARGKYFYDNSMETAKMLKTKFNWKIEIVDGVGHDQRKMAEAAAMYLYEPNI